MTDSGEAFGQAIGNLYLGGPANVAWKRALEGLTAGEAARVPNALPHSVAQVVAHVQFWQAYLLRVIAGENPPGVAHAAEGWPEPGDWDVLKAAFLHDSARFRDLAEDGALVQTLDRKGRPYAMALTNFAGHSLYHLGQVVSIRQALRLWPPPGGGYEW